MKKEIVLKGMIKGMEDMGAIFLKYDDQSIYFAIPEGCEMDNIKKISIAKQAFEKVFELNLVTE